MKYNFEEIMISHLIKSIILVLLIIKYKKILIEYISINKIKKLLYKKISIIKKYIKKVIIILTNSIFKTKASKIFLVFILYIQYLFQF